MRFPDLSALQHEPRGVPAQAPSPHPSETSTAGAPQTRNLTTPAALAPAALPVNLINFPVVAALPPIGHSRFCLRYRTIAMFTELIFAGATWR